MAKKKASTRGISAARVSEESESDVNLSSKVKEIFNNPALKHVAAEFATSALNKFFTKFSKRYPELMHVLTGGLDNIENKLVNYKNDKRDKNLQH